MAGQSIFCRVLSIFNNGNKVILTNRINHANFTLTCQGLKQHTKDPAKNGIPEKPKRPLTAFFTFMSEKRPIIVKQNPALSPTDIVKKLSEEWKFLSLATRAKYEEEARQNKAMYDEKMIEYVEKLTPEQEIIIREMENEKREDKQRRKLRKENRDEHKPKKPPTSFGYFMIERNKERDHKKEKSMPDFMKDLKDQWAKMTDEEKNKYILKYNKDKQQYEKELAAWEKKMMAAGKDQLVRTKTLKEHFSKETSHE